MADATENVAEKLQALVEARDEVGLTAYLADVHPADLAEALHGLPEEFQDALFLRLDSEKAGEVLRESNDSLQRDLVDALDEHFLSDILEEMSPDDAADVVGAVAEEDTGQEKVRAALRLMDAEERGEIQQLLQHPEDSAGGIMTSDFIAFQGDRTVGEVLNILRSSPQPESESQSEETFEQRIARIAHDEDVYNIYVVDEKQRLLGYTTLQDLAMAAPETPLAELVRTSFVSVNVNADQEEAAGLISRYDLLAVPVVDDDGTLVGRITFDDALDVLEEEASEDILRIGGTSEEELVEGKTLTAFKARFPWLFTTMVGGLICAVIIRNCEADLQGRLTALAYFIPVIMAMGGSLGNQSAALIIRGLATGQMSATDGVRILLGQVRVGAVIGLVNAVILCTFVAAGCALGWLGPETGFDFAVSVSFAMLIANAAASLIGSFIPLFLTLIKIDPAIAAVPFIAALNDMVGLMVYFLVITALL